MGEEEDVSDAQKELAGIAIQNGLLQLSLWDRNFAVEETEVQELSESVLPRVNFSDFQKYLDTFKILDHIQCDDQDTQENSSSIDICDGLPQEFYQSDFCLENPSVWNFVFPSEVSRWDDKILELERFQDQLQDHAYNELLRRGESLQLINDTYQTIASLILELFERIKSERSLLGELFNTMGLFCEECSKLKRKRRNLENLVTVVHEIDEINMLIQNISTTLESDDAARLHQETIVDAYEDLQSKTASLGKEYIIVQSLANHGLDRKVSTLLMNSMRRHLTDIYLKDILESDQPDTTDRIVTAVSQFLNITGDLHALKTCLDDQIEKIIHEKVCMQLATLTINQSTTTLATMLSFCLKQNDGAYLAAKILSEISLEIISRSVYLDEHCKRSNVPCWEFDFVKMSYLCLSSIWEGYFRDVAFTLENKELLKPLEIERILKHYYRLETGCSSLGVLETGLTETLQEFCGMLLDKVFAYCSQSLEHSMYDETWQYVGDISQLSAKLSDLLGLNGQNIGVESNADKVEISGRSYGLVNCMETLFDCLICFRDYSIAFQQCSSHCGTKAEEILRLFNRMASELVLGAGAIRLTKLKSITVKHLSICCEQISLVITLTRDLPFYSNENRSKDTMPEHDFATCIQVMTSHCTKIKEKIVSVACELMIPLMKDASMALTSNIKNGSCDHALLPEFTDLVDAMMRNFNIVTKVTRGSLGADEVDEMLEAIWEEIIVWIKDAAMSYGSEQSAVGEVYLEHLKYVQAKLDKIYPAKCVTQLRSDLENILKGKKV